MGSAPRARIATPFQGLLPMPERGVARVAQRHLRETLLGGTFNSCRHDDVRSCITLEPLGADVGETRVDVIDVECSYFH